MFAIGSTLLAANIALLAAPTPDLPPVTRTAKPYPTAPTCHSIAPDKTAVLREDDAFDELTSAGTSYASRETCDRFVADFSVLPGASSDRPSDGLFKVGGGLAASVYHDCEGSRIDVRVYKKARGASTFTTYSHQVLEGDFIDVPDGLPYCSWKLVQGAPGAEAEPNKAGTDTYRVAIKAWRNGAAQPVEARIMFNETII